MLFTRKVKETWTLLEKVSFRFLFTYFSFYSFTLIGSSLFKPLVFWFAEGILNISYDFSEKGSGSGDTTYQYVLLLIILLLSVLIASLWSIFDRKRPSYNQLNYFLILLLRFVLIIFLFIYGFIKVFHMQMVPPTYSQLLGTLGDMSPMGLAWTFMGYSKTYIVFAGLAEVIAGLLLISRRLQTVGSLFVVAVMGNVFIMNMAFDIPVKIFSFHLMLMGIFLFLTKGKRFWDSVILRKAVDAEKSYPMYAKNAQDVIRGVKGTIAFFAVVICMFMGFGRSTSFEKRFHPKLGGAWEVTYFEKNGAEEVPILTNKTYWRYFIVDFEGSASVMTMDRTLKYFSMELDSLAKTITLIRRDSDLPIQLEYERNDNELEIKGLFDSDSLRIKMTRKGKENFPLTNRGFRWINERPNGQ